MKQTVIQASLASLFWRSGRESVLICLAVLGLVLSAGAWAETPNGEIFAFEKRVGHERGQTKSIHREDLRESCQGFEEEQENSPRITFIWFPSLSFSPLDPRPSPEESVRKAKPMEECPVNLERRRQNLRRQLKELEAAGQMDRAAQVQDRLKRLESPRGTRLLGPKEEKQAAKRPPTPITSQPAEMRGRLHHLELAIENLHAAGLHENAEELTKAAERMRQRRRAQEGLTPVRSSDPVNRLRVEVRDLRESVQELQREMRQMRQDAP